MESFSKPGEDAACAIDTKTIFVTGATGDTGRPTVRLLLQRGHRVGALARKDDERSRELKELGAEIILGDMLQISDIRRALRLDDRAKAVGRANAWPTCAAGCSNKPTTMRANSLANKQSPP